MKYLREILASAGLFFLVTLCFWPVHSFEFIDLDDNDYITENVFVASGLKPENIVWAFTEFHSGHWHPLSWVSHMLDCQLFGLDPGPHHLVNLALHASSAVLLFLFLLRTTSFWGASLFCALIFALHPMRVESVAWVAERKDVLSVFFALCALHAYVFFRHSRQKKHYCLLLFFFCLSLLSKPTFVSLPILLILLDWWPMQRFTDIRLGDKRLQLCIVEKIPLALFSLLSCILTIYSQSAGGGLKDVNAYPLSDRIPSVLFGYLIYAGKVFWPHPLAILYPFQSYPPGSAIAALLGLLAISYLSFYHRRRYPMLLFGWLWFIISLIPMIGIVQIGGQAYADRWSYVPHIGIIVGLTYWVMQNFRGSLKILSGLAIALVLASALVLRGNLVHWRDSEQIFTHTLRVTKNNFLIHNNLGVFYSKRGDFAQADFHINQANKIRPQYPNAMNNLGKIKAQEGNSNAARALFQKALQINPNLLSARYNLGLLAAQDGQVHKALVYWVNTLQRDVHYQAARDSLHWILTKNKGDVLDIPVEQVDSYESAKQTLENWEIDARDQDLHRKLCQQYKCSKP